MNQHDYREAGFRVFGIHKIVNGKCGCGIPDCNAVGKHPVVNGWQNTPDWSDEQFEVMEEAGHFATGFGVLCTGWLVVDVDARNGGVESLNKLEKALGLQLDSGFVVATGSGGGSRHIYYKMPDDVRESLRVSLPDYPGIDFKTSGYVVGAGSLHASGALYEPIKGHPDDVTPAPMVLVDALKRPETYRSTGSDGVLYDTTADDVRSMLSYIDPDCQRDIWLRVAMGIHHHMNGDGFELFDKWSKEGKKYKGHADTSRVWHSLGKSSDSLVTISTVAHYAKEKGWQSSLDTFSEEELESLATVEDAPIADLLVGVDMKRPPGLVGEIAQWINSKCRYPRENLAVASALYVVGNIGGLFHEDEQDDISTNLMMFCVAGSSTGKEAVMQAQNECFRAVGMAGCLHGAIKSEIEIIKNLIHHQAAVYVIDEFGIVLRKIRNAAKSGASYLEGTIGTLMSAYSKATGFMPVGGDMKKQVQAELEKEMAFCQRKIDENEDQSGNFALRLTQCQRLYRGIESGLERPFLSVMGFTTPSTFDSLVDYESVANGFFARALIFDEAETNPKPRDISATSKAFPEGLRMKLLQLCSMGNYQPGGRIENYSTMSAISTTNDGIAALVDVQRFFWVMAEQVKSMGLEAIPRRGYEIAAKLSMILAMGDGVRTKDHILWAFAVAKRDIERKLALTRSNEVQKSSPSDSIRHKVLTILADGDPVGVGIIINRCRPHKKAAVQAVLDQMAHERVVRKTPNSRGTFSYSI